MTANPETAGVEPVAWLYENAARGLRFVDHDHNDARAVWARSMAHTGWTETPLYAHPPTAREDGDDLADAAVSDAANLIAENFAANQSGLRAAAREGIKHGYRIRPAPEHAPDRAKVAIKMARNLDKEDGGYPPPVHANCAVGEGEPTPQQGLGEELDDLIRSLDWPHPKALRVELISAMAQGGQALRDMRAALAAMPTPAAIRAETTAEIVEWCREGAAVYAGHNMVSHGEVYSELADALERGDHLTGGENVHTPKT